MARQESQVFLAEGEHIRAHVRAGDLATVGTEQFGPVPLGGMTYWSGVWATAILLLALAITPALKIFRWRELIDVRRMIGVTVLAYTIAHIFIYFALRFWNFASIAHEMVTRLSLILASVATIGLVALGATSVDAAVQRMGAKGWQRLHNTVYVFAALALIHYLLSPPRFQFRDRLRTDHAAIGDNANPTDREPLAESVDINVGSGVEAAAQRA